MNVLSVIHYPFYGGPHNRNRRLVPLLEARGIHVTVVIPDDEGNARERLLMEGVRTVALPMSRMRASANLRTQATWLAAMGPDVSRLRRLIRERSIDIVQINGLVNAQGAFAARAERVPVVWQLLDTYTPMALRWVMMPIVRRLASVIMSTGVEVARLHPGATADPARLVTFFPPVQTDEFQPDEARRLEARAALHVGADELVVGMIANINRQKGHRLFIEAAAALKTAHHGKTRFLLVGRVFETAREYAQDLWRQASELGLVIGRDILLVDPGTEVAFYASAIDVYWLTSEPRSEGIPTALEEAMALALPIVAVDVGGVREIILDGETGRLVLHRDKQALVGATMHMLSTWSAAQRLGARAREFALGHFTTEMCAKNHVRAYELARRSVSLPV